METLEQGMFEVNNKDVVLVSLLLTLNIFHTLFSSISIVNFEQVNVGWVILTYYIMKDAVVTYPEAAVHRCS